MVVSVTNTTQPVASQPSNVDSYVQSPWSSRVLGARSTAQRLLFPDCNPQPCRRSPAAAAESISAPVYCAKGTSSGAVLDQKTLDQRWAALLERLETLSLTEQEMFDVLESGFLQTATGSRLRELFVEALRRFGSMMASQVFRLTDNGVARLQTGMDQLRCFFGGFAANAGSINLPKRVNTLGAPVNGIYRNANFTAIQSNGNWYALDRGGDPYGQPLVEFKLSGVTEATTQV